MKESSNDARTRLRELIRYAWKKGFDLTTIKKMYYGNVSVTAKGHHIIKGFQNIRFKTADENSATSEVDNIFEDEWSVLEWAATVYHDGYLKGQAVSNTKGFPLYVFKVNDEIEQKVEPTDIDGFRFRLGRRSLIHDVKDKPGAIEFVLGNRTYITAEIVKSWQVEFCFTRSMR